MNAMARQTTLLLVDDDEDFLTQLKLPLEAAGYVTLSAHTLKEAEQLCQDRPIDLAIIDLMMELPDGGLTLCYRIRKQHPELPIILVSAVTSETGVQFDASTDEERSWVKADAFLAKPIRFEQLEAEVQRLLTLARCGCPSTR